MMSVPWSVVMKGRWRPRAASIWRASSALTEWGWRSGRGGDRAVELGDFGHARGEGEVVGRVFEERIAGDRNLVVEDAVVAAVRRKGCE